jgi:hypothetical protein
MEDTNRLLRARVNKIGTNKHLDIILILYYHTADVVNLVESSQFLILRT